MMMMMMKIIIIIIIILSKYRPTLCRPAVVSTLKIAVLPKYFIYQSCVVAKLCTFPVILPVSIVKVRTGFSNSLLFTFLT